MRRVARRAAGGPPKAEPAADAGPAAPQSPRCTIARNGSAAGPHLHPVRRVPFLVVDELAFLTAYPPERDLRKRAEAAIATLTS
jgi:hypothetical protein